MAQESLKLKKLSPILWTKDLNETISFYENVLGFQGKSNFPDFVSLTKGDVEIMFIVPRDEPADSKAPKGREFFPKTSLTGSLFISVDNVDVFWEQVKARATVKTALADREYWMRDFSILDNNGYELVFGEDISAKRS